MPNSPHPWTDYDRAVEATARGETVPNLPAVLRAAGITEYYFRIHVQKEEVRIGKRQRLDIPGFHDSAL